MWLEKGNATAGLEHILQQHEIDFLAKGISRDQITEVIMGALAKGQIIGTNGSANVYRIVYRGTEQNIAIGIASNGYVVRANPVSNWK